MPSFRLARLGCRFCGLVLNAFPFEPSRVAAHLVDLVAGSGYLFLSLAVKNCHVINLVSLLKRICLQCMQFANHAAQVSLAIVNRWTAYIGSHRRFLGILSARLNQNTGVLRDGLAFSSKSLHMHAEFISVCLLLRIPKLSIVVDLKFPFVF